MADAESIEDICKRLVKTDRITNCNWFVQAVGNALWGSEVGFLAGTANEIAPRLSDKSIFTPLGTSGDLATKYAGDGFFVVGGLAKSTGSGHVFVVVSGGPSPKGVTTPWKDAKGKNFPSIGGYPYAYNGSAAPPLRIPSRISVDLMFSRADMAKVTYGAIADPRGKGAAATTASSSTVALLSCHATSVLA